jgi:hypothetical protein
MIEHAARQRDTCYVTGRSLEDITGAISSSWSPETWYARPDTPNGVSYHPSRNQCGTSALVLQDWLGGDLLVADVTTNGRKAGVHYWNRLPDGREVDLTKEQFVAGETIRPPEVVIRKPGVPTNGRAAYLLLSHRVGALLGGTAPPDQHCDDPA